MTHNILVIGSGGREHALCWKLKQSPQAAKLFCAPGNGGIAQVAECVALKDHKTILKFCQEKDIALVVIGPEQPLVEGLGDFLRKANIPVFGPNKAAAQLEGSKAFTKDLCKEFGIPTAAYETFYNARDAKVYVARQRFPTVIKADGLAAGKGVIIAQNKKEAEAAIDSMFGGAFGQAGAKVVIEEFMEGEEVSFFALCDGNRAIYFGHAQDHKRAYDGDKGPNTGGMGTYAPAPMMTDALRDRVMREIINPTVAAMKKKNMPFQGVLFAGLMVKNGAPKLVEYNARFGDPETQVLMRRMDADLFPILMACALGTLGDITMVMNPKACVCIVMAAKGYPGTYEKGSEIKGLDRVGDAVMFHAGTAAKDGKIIATGGRVLGVTAMGNSIKEAQAAAYKAVDSIDWPEGFCRRDIAYRAIKS